MNNLPRVSAVLDTLDWGYGDIPPFILKRAAKYGTGFHGLMEKKTTGKKSRVTKQYKVRYEALEDWFKQRNYKVKEAEIRLTFIEGPPSPGGLNNRRTNKYDISHTVTTGKGYQGTCDAILEDKNGGLILIDYKTGRVSKRHFLQSAAYKMAYEQQTGLSIAKIIIVKPTKEGLVEEYDLDKPVEHYEKVFLRLLDKYYNTNA